MGSNFHKLHTALFTGFLLLGGGLCVLHAPRDFSEMENRVLTSFPTVTFDGVKRGDVQRDFEKAAGDQMIGRDSFVRLATGTRYLMGERQIGDVYIGDDGRYLEKVTDADISEKRLNTNISVVEKLAQDHPGMRSTVFLAPTNAVVASEALPKGAYIYDDKEVIDKIKTGLNDASVIYEPDAFSPEEYFSTDHHWNTYGALRGAGMYLQSVGMAAPAGGYEIKKADEPFFGTLYSKAPLAACRGEVFCYPAGEFEPEVIIDGKKGSLYDTSFLDKKDKYAAYFGGNFGRVDIKNHSSDDGDTLLLVKDSFANSAIPYLYPAYNRIIMIDLRYYNSSFTQLLKEESPKELVFFYEMSDFCQDENFSKLLK